MRRLLAKTPVPSGCGDGLTIYGATSPTRIVESWRVPASVGPPLVTLAIVIGANSAMFSAVHAVILRPFAVQQPDELVISWGSDLRRNLPIVELSYRNFEDWARKQPQLRPPRGGWFIHVAGRPE